MAGKKQFINPLTRSSESTLNVPIVTDNQTSAQADLVGPGVKPKRVKGRGVVFEATHQRFTSWVDKKLKKQFDELADQKGVSKSALLDEAISVLLHRQERKPYTRQSNTE